MSNAPSKENKENNVTYLADYQPPDYWVRHVELEFDIRDGETFVKARLHVERNGTHDRPLVLDGEQMELLDVKLDGDELAPGENLAEGYVVDDKSLSLQPPADDMFVLETEVRIEPEKNTSLNGLYQSGGTWCTQCESQGFRRITYFVDRPDNMATFKVKVTGDTDKAPVLLSNGNLIDQGEAGDGRHFTVWEDPFPKPSYLFALVGGDLDYIEDTYETMSGRTVTLRIFADAKDLDKLGHAMESLKQSMKWDEEVYGREYELDLFNIVAVEDFNFGAMENTSLNIFNTALALAHPRTATDDNFERVQRVIAHEYFHNWTGNRVTCRDWFQLCLKEGLTVFRDQEFGGDMGARAVKRINDVRGLRASQFTEDAGPMAHPPRPDHFVTINNFYTRTVYNKGAELNRMLHTLLGPEDFRKASDLYFDRFDGQAVTVEDWVQCMEDASGRDLSQFMLWYTQAGTPTVKADWSYDEDTQDFTLTLRQDVPEIEKKSDGAPRHIPVKFGLVGPDGEDIVDTVLELTEEEQSFTFENVPPGSVPSILRNFSAPVTLEAPYNNEELRHLMIHDSDGFNQWEAGNRVLTAALLEQIDNYEAGRPVAVSDDVIGALRDVLARTDMDDELKSLALTLPSFQALAPQRDVIDPHAIAEVRKIFTETIGIELRDELLAVYEKAYQPEKPYDLEDAGRRAIQNLALAYLARGADADQQDLIGSGRILLNAARQFYTANNMTEQYAAFNVLLNLNDFPKKWRADIVEAFYDEFKNDALVVDKWVAAQAMSGAGDILETVAALRDHEAMQGTGANQEPSPNRQRALYASFALGNPRGFHAEDGAGYKFFADFVIDVDGKNPQMAARMVAAFEDFRRYKPELQALMEEQLSRIASIAKISTDLGEKLENYLGREAYARLRAGNDNAAATAADPAAATPR